MRKCRTVELKHCNELFLQFCMAYGTPEQEKYRAKYESADMDERKKKAKEKVSGDGSDPMRVATTGMLPHDRSLFKEGAEIAEALANEGEVGEVVWDFTGE